MKKMIAIFMTLLMVAAMLPITASAAQCARIVVELNEPYYGENLAEILPEIEIEAAYPFIEGYAFTVYYDHASDEDAYEAAEKLKTNPLVKAAAYCPDNEVEITRAMFEISLVESYYGENNYLMAEAELGKLFPEMRIERVTATGRKNYWIYSSVDSIEEISDLYEDMKANPFLRSMYC